MRSNYLFVPTPATAHRFLTLWWRRGTTTRYAYTMKSISLGLTLLYALSGMPAAAGTSGQDACENFFRALKVVPNQKLTRKNGEHKSFFDGKRYIGCEVELVSKIKLIPDPIIIPSFSAEEGTDLYRSGWRMHNSYVADAGGSSAFGIEKREVLCLIMYDQPDSDENGKIIENVTLTILVQCRNTHNKPLETAR